jgi:RecJ-like exonuclease
MSLTGTITFTGNTREDALDAINEAARLIGEGFTSGGDRNEDSSFSINVEGSDDHDKDASDEPVCRSCGKNPGHNDVAQDCYECGKRWNIDFCDGCGKRLTGQDVEAEACTDCGEKVPS